MPASGALQAAKAPFLGARRSARTRSNRPASRKAVSTVAKYTPKESQYFDLQDVENTVGAWDVYGKDAPNRYPSLQADAFEKFTAPFKSRKQVLSLLLIGSVTAMTLYGLKGMEDAGVPAKTGIPYTGEQLVVNGRQ